MEEKMLAKANEILNILLENGYSDAFISGIGGGRIDVNIEIGRIQVKKSLTEGRFGVFWNRNGNPPKIEYLCAGQPHFDGYEVQREWKVVTIDNIIEVVEKDIEILKKYQSKQLKYSK